MHQIKNTIQTKKKSNIINCATFVTLVTCHLVYIPKNIGLKGALSFIEGAVY